MIVERTSISGENVIIPFPRLSGVKKTGASLESPCSGTLFSLVSACAERGCELRFVSCSAGFLPAPRGADPERLAQRLGSCVSCFVVLLFCFWFVCVCFCVSVFLCLFFWGGGRVDAGRAHIFETNAL